MLWILMLAILREFCWMFLLIQIAKNVIWIDFTCDEVDFYNLFQYKSMNRILISINGSNENNNIDMNKILFELKSRNRNRHNELKWFLKHLYIAFSIIFLKNW
jgi:hypothetical protein